MNTYCLTNKKAARKRKSSVQLSDKHRTVNTVEKNGQKRSITGRRNNFELILSCFESNPTLFFTCTFNDNMYHATCNQSIMTCITYKWAIYEFQNPLSPKRGQVLNLSCESEFYLHENKYYFQIGGFALSLALKQRLEATCKWLIRQ